jgi:hypothetical protein
MSYSIDINITQNDNGCSVSSNDTNNKSANYTFNYPDTSSFYGIWHTNNNNQLFGNMGYSYIGTSYNIFLLINSLNNATITTPNVVSVNNIYTINLYSYISKCTSGNVNSFVANYIDNTINNVNNIYFTISSDIPLNSVPTCSSSFNDISANVIIDENYNVTYTFYSDSSQLNIISTIVVKLKYSSSGWIPLSCTIQSVNSSNSQLCETIGFLANLYYLMSYYIKSNYLTSLSNQNRYYETMWNSQISLIGALAPIIQIYFSE